MKKIQKLIYYCELGCDTSHTVRTRIHPNIEEKQGKMQPYQQLHRHGMQDRSRSRKENSNLKVLMEAGIKPMEMWIIGRQMRQWIKYHDYEDKSMLVTQQLAQITAY